MLKSSYPETDDEANISLNTDILSLFSHDVASAIREYTCSALAKELNLTPHALEQIISNRTPEAPPAMGIRFFARRLHHFA